MHISKGHVTVAALVFACLLPHAATAAGPNNMDAQMDTKLQAVLAGDHRSDANRARDAYRNPHGTLKFFGISEGMTVMEIWPSSGWYTEVLAPLMKDSGKYIAAHWDPESPSKFVQNSVKRFTEKMNNNPDVYSQVEIVALMPQTGKSEPVPPGSVDMVLTFRNVHNWMGQNYQEDMFNVFQQSLRPGGYLAIVEHRGDSSVPQDPKAKSGYVNEEHTVQLAEAAGFELLASSDVNNNPRDTKDYEKGVWTLPPTYRNGYLGKKKYGKIGESDRFTLLFVKPSS